MRGENLCLKRTQRLLTTHRGWDASTGARNVSSRGAVGGRNECPTGSCTRRAWRQVHSYVGLGFRACERGAPLLDELRWGLRD